METSRWVDEKLTALNVEPSDGNPGWEASSARTLRRIRAQGRQHGSGRPRWMWASATVLAGSLGTIAFPAPRAAAQRVLAPCVGACESFFSKAVVSRGGTNPAAPTIGSIAPDFTMAGADGESIRLADYRGKVVLLNFWATWCPPCRAEMPWFVEFERSYGAKGFAAIGISMDESGWKAVRPFQKAHGIQYALGIGNDALAQQFGGVDSLPETLLIDRDGKIAAKYVGIVSRTEYEGAIRKLLSN